MTHPAPHNFTQSPVEEVFCSCTPEIKSLSISLTTPAPYPGWEKIRTDLQKVISTHPDTTRYTSCVLRYSDRFQHSFLDGTADTQFSGVDLNHHLHDRIIGRIGNETIISSAILFATSSIRYSPGEDRENGILLIFTVQTDAIRLSGEEVITWFDAAHAEIHTLFDLCVPDELMNSFI